MPRRLLFLLLLVLAAACSRAGKWEQTMKQGHRCLKKERYEQAKAAYDRALALRPGHPEALMGRAAAFVGQNRLPEALADMNAAIAADPRPQWRSRRGMLLYALGRYPEALSDLNAVLAAFPGHAPSLAARGMVHLRMHNCDAAKTDFRAARKRRIPVPQEWDSACTPAPEPEGKNVFPEGDHH